MDDDELNEYLEWACGRCDDCRCNCDDYEQSQELLSIAPNVNDDYVEQYND